MIVVTKKRKSVLRSVYLAMLIVALSLIVSSCGSRRNQVSPNYAEPSKTKEPITNPRGKPMSNTPAAKKLVAEAREWIGTPYKYGGESKSGADCSGFIMQVYIKATGLKLPRNSAAQCDFCTKIKKEELETGDLIFFSSNSSKGRVAHVGMYIGDGIMIHASSSRGVIETDIHSNYFVRHYVASGRVPSDAPKATPKQKENAASASSSKTKQNTTKQSEKSDKKKPSKSKQTNRQEVPVTNNPQDVPQETPEEIVKQAFGVK